MILPKLQKPRCPHLPSLCVLEFYRAVSSRILRGKAFCPAFDSFLPSGRGEEGCSSLFRGKGVRGEEGQEPVMGCFSHSALVPIPLRSRPALQEVKTRFQEPLICQSWPTFIAIQRGMPWAFGGHSVGIRGHSDQNKGIQFFWLPRMRKNTLCFV